MHSVAKTSQRERVGISNKEKTNKKQTKTNKRKQRNKPINKKNRHIFFFDVILTLHRR